MQSTPFRLGAQIWSAKVQNMLKATNKTMLFVDSFIGVFPESQNLKRKTGDFSIIHSETDNKCYNVSSNYQSNTTVLSSPVGKIIDNDWDACVILRKNFPSLVSNETLDNCDRQLFNIHQYFNEQFSHMDSPIAFINSKADHVQREFATMVGFTVSNYSGIDTGLDQQNSIVQQATFTCLQNGKNYSYCEEMKTCVNC
eukprot:Awhi_evm2s13047